MNISINTERCTLCGKCVKVCPSSIFVGKQIEVVNPDSCIKCGQCVAVCGFQAIEHELFPEDRVHKIDYNAMPSPEQVLLLTKMRRSTRNFRPEGVPMEKLDMILEAAHRAPTATNSQKLFFTLVTDKQMLHNVSQFTLDTFQSLVGKVDNPIMRPLIKRFVPGMNRYLPLFKKMKLLFEQGDDKILRGATALVVIHAPANSRYGCEDANLAYQNGSLMAQALGVGQFYGGFVLNATQRRRGVLEKMLGIEGKIFAVMALGVPQFRYDNYPDRNDIICNKI